MPATGRWREAVLCHLSVNKYQLAATQYQVDSLFKMTKSLCQVALQEKWLLGYLWCRSSIRAHNKLTEAEI